MLFLPPNQHCQSTECEGMQRVRVMLSLSDVTTVTVIISHSLITPLIVCNINCWFI